MNTRVVEIDGREMKSEADFHHQIAQAMAFPDYYGNNLDALWDSLSGFVDTDVVLRWKDSQIAKEKLGSRFDQIIHIFERTQKLWPNFEFHLD